MKKKIIIHLLLVLIFSGCNLPSTPAQSPEPATLPARQPTNPSTSPTIPAVPTNANPAPPEAMTADTHPRLWLTPKSVELYRTWAAADNPVWQDGLEPLAEQAKADMDTGKVPGQDCGSVGYSEYATEMYAEFFAFLSQVSPDETARTDYARRAHTLLMFVMTEAAKGPASQENYSCDGSQQYPPFRHPDFYTADRDRARYYGEGFPLTVDWIYPTLTVADKRTIRSVFLKWANDIITRGYHHPEPVGVINDPSLLTDPQQVRYSGNNYYTAHMRNLGLMAMSFSPQDDPDGQLHKYLDTATGAYLYIFNHFIQTDARGGMLPEGFEYSPQTAAYAAQFLWAMQTAQKGNSDTYVDRPFWSNFISAYFNAISPGPVMQNIGGEQLSAYQPSMYGDAQEVVLGDFINVFGALGHLTGFTSQQNALRWLVTNTPAGGAGSLLVRVGKPDNLRHALLYFMLLDPHAAPAIDPRPSLPVDFLAAGMNRVFSRSDWSPEAAWFTYRLTWNTVDHQMADGNSFEFYRKGEWLTKGRSGYADIAEGIASSEFYNTLAIQNNRPPDRDDSDWRIDLWRRGSQWNHVSDGDPHITAYSATPTFVAATGDATNLYNSTSESATDVLLASRSIVWLKPDFIFVYDRAETKSAGHFKRWWLQLAAPAQVKGNQARSVTAGGQQLFVTVLLPENTSMQAVNTVEQHITDTVAVGETMTVRLMTAAPGDPLSARFLHVLQGADSGAASAAVTLVRSEDGGWEGAAVNHTVVLFARTADQALNTVMAYTAPTDTNKHIITGLTPGAGYDVALETASTGVQVTIRPGTQFTADTGGVLVFP